MKFGMEKKWQKKLIVDFRGKYWCRGGLTTSFSLCERGKRARIPHIQSFHIDKKSTLLLFKHYVNFELSNGWPWSLRIVVGNADWNNPGCITG
jgi:hypothetical protein